MKDTEMLEIERKFLVKDQSFKDLAFKSTHIAQGYLNSSPERVVRVRLYGDAGFITVKGRPNEEGTTRFEWEREIAEIEAKALLKLCEKGVIQKTRYLVKAGRHTYEIDEFDGENRGLVVAEIELSAAAEVFKCPEWLGREVTGEMKYYNSQLSKMPYSQWE